MTQTCGFIYCTHTYWSARDARSDFSICRLTKWGHKYMNNIPRTARRVTSWAFDRFIWVKRSSYHIYIGYRNLKCPHGNLSKYKFGLAEYITVYVIQLGLWRYWIFPYRGEAATNIAVWRLIAGHPPPSKKKLTWSHFCKSASARCRATAHCSRSQISLITWRDAILARALGG